MCENVELESLLNHVDMNLPGLCKLSGIDAELQKTAVVAGAHVNASISH